MSITLNKLRFFAIITFCITVATSVFGQNLTIRGKVVDHENTPVIGANVYFLTSFQGQATNAEGEFEIRSKGKAPFIYVISAVGFETVQDTIFSPGEVQVDVKLEEAILLGKEVVVSASLVEENIMRSTVSVEKLELTQIQQMPQANFYDGLAQLKGIDMNTQSLTFKVPNSRGFNSNTNYRFNQITDGVNSQAPGLNFAAGNLFGVPHLDVESVEFLSGASSALYGAGGMNGTLLINSKDPFDYQGLSASVQVGVLNLGANSSSVNTSGYTDFNWRYSAKITDKLAFKFTGAYLSSEDWVAGDQRDKTALDDANSTRETNPGYDGVNVYGDEVAVNLGLIAPAVADGFARAEGFEPGQSGYDSLFNGIVGIIPNQDVTRTGYLEEDLVNYDVRNLKAALGFHYKINDDITAILSGTYSEGQAVYSAQNRFSISDFQLYNLKAEINSEDFLVRYWYVTEDAGLTYDAGGTAALINEAWKSTEDWLGDYITGYLVGSGQFNFTEAQAHDFARSVADNRDGNNNVINREAPARPLPGSPRFIQLRDSISAIPINQGGGRVLDFSSMGQIEGRYNFSRLLGGTDVIVGFQYRYFLADSDGTIFADEPGNPININQFGIYGQYIETFIDDRLKVNLSARWDRDTNLDAEFTPRASFVYSAGPKRNHNIRASVQTAFRYPSIADQWVDLDVGALTVVGGQRSVQDMYQLGTVPTYPLIGVNPVFAVPDTTTRFTPSNFRSETVFALELGYKAISLDEKFFVDLSVFRNLYDRFQGSQLLVQDPFTADERRFQTSITTDINIVNWGWSAGGTYLLPRGFTLGGNITYSTIEGVDDVEEGFQTNFNTPRYRYNISLGNRKLIGQLGFNINYHYQEAFLWESTFGVGEVPAYGTLDVVLNYKFPAIKTRLKLGASNILNEYYTTSFGSSSIGGLYYITLIYDQFLK